MIIQAQTLTQSCGSSPLWSLLVWQLAFAAAQAEDHEIPHGISTDFIIDTRAVTGGTQLSPAKSSMLSTLFELDTRDVHRLSDRVSTGFVVDTRTVDGIAGSGVSGISGLDTGAYLMGVPVVQGVSPAIVPGVEGRQWITLRGQNFQSGARVVLRTGSQSYSIPAERTQFVSAAEIRIFVNLTSVPADWTVQMTNPGGTPSARLSFSVVGSSVTPPGTVDFGTVAPGAFSDRVVTLRNTGNQPTNWTATVGGPFSVVGSDFGSLAVAQSITVTLRYSPTTPNPHAATARIALGGQVHQRALSGRSLASSLPATGVLNGRVVTMTSIFETPVPDAEVRLLFSGNAVSGLLGRTDRDGRFTFTGIRSGTYQAIARPTRGELMLGEENTSVSIGNGSSTVTLTLPYTPLTIHGPKDYPVVLVRGIGKNGIGDDAYWQAMRQGLCAAGFTVWDPNKNDPNWPLHHDEITRLKGEEDYDYNAERLRTFIRLKSNAAHPPGIHIVAHSMGGSLPGACLRPTRNIAAPRRSCRP